MNNIMRNLRLFFELLKLLAEMQCKSTVLEASPVFRELSLAILDGSYGEKFFEVLPTSIMNLVRAMMLPANQEIKLESNRLDDC